MCVNKGAYFTFSSSTRLRPLFARIMPGYPIVVTGILHAVGLAVRILGALFRVSVTFVVLSYCIIILRFLVMLLYSPYAAVAAVLPLAACQVLAFTAGHVLDKGICKCAEALVLCTRGLGALLIRHRLRILDFCVYLVIRCYVTQQAGMFYPGIAMGVLYTIVRGVFERGEPVMTRIQGERWRRQAV